ncbi:MAG TPA: bifunctional diaminohydroxyphosphoribosylaminopyrimidine deaminase/5-amino-6-(5-phosphoribosylamino)uracil reductase RibD [Solirubrobacterales bacterium]|nr:bifunctional diaminohydroxyphosphoribosylaminopyrimidine deaminase/5-amino-6-(5-phosphoribosylamino)uracil reductase RibD [Solirubrobacterales bacterium]
MPLTETDTQHLRRALELAERGRGRVSPNPLVGAVIVRDGRVIGEGFHAELGGLHAERAALADCRERGEGPAGATMYVTLEPCAHEGRQPPCVEAVLEAGIARVVVASDDPSEKAAGRGPGILRDGGVEVELAAGAEASAARLLNQPFRKHARTGLPLVTLKLAMSLDGRTATAPGDSPWISGEQSRELVHRWRAEHDAIAVGIGTVLADDPLLTARPDSAATYSHPSGSSRSDRRRPLRVVFDRQARTPLDSQLLETLDEAPLLVVTSPDADRDRVGALREAGAEVLVAADIEAALRDLGRREITSIFLEGGRTLASAFLAADQLDESRTFIAPVLLGGGDEATTTGPARRSALTSSTEQVGEDVLVIARYKEW